MKQKEQEERLVTSPYYLSDIFTRKSSLEVEGMELKLCVIHKNLINLIWYNIKNISNRGSRYIMSQG